MLLLSFLLSPAGAQEIGAIVTPEAAVDLAADRPGEDGVEVRTRFRGFARGDTSRDGSWFLEVRAVNEILAGDDVEGAWIPWVGESGWEGRLGGPVRLRAGNLVERWGKLDLLPVVDVLNPRDYRFGPTTPADWQRMPNPMATLQIGDDRVRSETTLIPISTGDRLSLRDTDWSFVRQGMLFDLSKTAQGWPGDSDTLFQEAMPITRRAIAELDPTFRRGLDAAINSRELPQAFWINGEIAQRFELAGDGFDVAIMGANLRNRQPLSQMKEFLVGLLQDERLPNQNEIPLAMEALFGPINVSWPRTWMVGADAGTVVGPFGLRAEGAWFSDKTLRGRWLQGTTRPWIGAGAGVDYSRGTWLLVTLEARYEQTLDPPQDMLLQAPQNVQLGGGVRLAGVRDRLELTLGGSYDVAFQEVFLRPTASFRISDPFELNAGALILGGPHGAPRTLLDAMVYEGGPAGYWSQNDVVTFGLGWIL